MILLFKNMENEKKIQDDLNKESNENKNKEENYITDNKIIIENKIKIETNNKKEEIKEKDNEAKIQENNENEKIKVENNEKEGEKIDPHLIFQKELLNIIDKQEKILSATSTINEKFDVSNQITKEQIASFKINIDKYGKYLLMIKKELGMISDTMRKIKKLANEKNKK